MNLLTWLSKWYTDNCDGDWEHQSGIKISTLDNPGWSIVISLDNTLYAGRTLFISKDVSDKDWHVIKCDGNIFRASGDASKLSFLISSFKDFVEDINNNKFHKH